MVKNLLGEEVTPNEQTREREARKRIDRLCFKIADAINRTGGHATVNEVSEGLREMVRDVCENDCMVFKGKE